jgi:hypothetical protein
MKTILLLLGVTLALCSCDNSKTKESQLNREYTETTEEHKEEYAEDIVYVCTGGSARRYHNEPDCRGLSRCRGDIEEMSVEDAESEGKTPCRICY